MKKDSSIIPCNIFLSTLSILLAILCCVISGINPVTIFIISLVSVFLAFNILEIIIYKKHNNNK